MKEFFARLMRLCYPPHCALCHRLLNEQEQGVCRFCRKKYENSCIRRELDCVRLCVAPFRYEGEVRDSLLRYKFHGVTAYGAAYAEFLAKCIDESDISCDIITWVPLSRRRLRSRGYDQARILAEETAQRLGLPCEQLLKKINLQQKMKQKCWMKQVSCKLMDYKMIILMLLNLWMIFLMMGQ